MSAFAGLVLPGPTSGSGREKVAPRSDLECHFAKLRHRRLGTGAIATPVLGQTGNRATVELVEVNVAEQPQTRGSSRLPGSRASAQSAASEGT